MTLDFIKSVINDADERELVNAWNYVCDETGRYDEQIYSNDNDTYRLMFNDDIDEALRAAHYGNYNYTDEYCTLNCYGNLDTFSDLWDADSPYYEDTLVEYFNEHQDELEDYFDFDPEEEEDDYDDDDDDDETYYCPICGEELHQGDYEYDYDYGELYVCECPNCGCSGEKVVTEDDEE